MMFYWCIRLSRREEEVGFGEMDDRLSTCIKLYQVALSFVNFSSPCVVSVSEPCMKDGCTSASRLP